MPVLNREDMGADKRQALLRLQVLELLFKLMYETLGDQRYGRRGGYRRMQVAGRTLAAALSRCQFSDDPSRGTETMRWALVLREEFARFISEEACSEQRKREAEALIRTILRMAEEMAAEAVDG